MPKIKGIVKGYQNFDRELVIDIGKKEGYKRIMSGRVPQTVGTTLIDNKDFVKIGVTVRINFRGKDRK